MRESVVLPLPDSPTIVKISGSGGEIAKLTSSTARNGGAAKEAAAGIDLA